VISNAGESVSYLTLAKEASLETYQPDDTSLRGAATSHTLTISSIQDQLQIGAVNESSGRIIEDTVIESSIPEDFLTTGPKFLHAEQIPFGESTFDLNAVLFDKSTTSITFASPVINHRSGAYIAVSEVSLRGSELTAFMSSLELHGGLMFITTDQGYLVASSDGSFDLELVDHAEWSPGDEPLRATQYDDVIVRSAAGHLLDVFNTWGGVASAGPIHLSDVKLGGDKYFLDTVSVSVANGETSLVMVLLMPRAVIMGNIDKAGQIQLVVDLAVIGVTVVVGGLLLVVLHRKLVDVGALQALNVRYQEAKRAAESTSRYLANTR
jgi:hypothetical protein